MANFIQNLSHTLFISLNIGIAVLGLISLIYGLSSRHYSSYFWTGGFIGGWIPSLGLSAILYGCMGLYAAWRHNMAILYAYGYLAAASLGSRLLTIILAGAHSIGLPWYVYFGIVLELIILIVTYMKTSVVVTVQTA